MDLERTHFELIRKHYLGYSRKIFATPSEVPITVPLALPNLFQVIILLCKVGAGVLFVECRHMLKL